MLAFSSGDACSSQRMPVPACLPASCNTAVPSHTRICPFLLAVGQFQALVAAAEHDAQLRKTLQVRAIHVYAA